MTRKILGLIAGYLIFALSAVIYFRLTGHEPNLTPTVKFVIITSVYGAIFSLIGGFVLQIIAKTGNLKLNYLLAFIIAGFALFSLFKTDGNHWTQIVSILVFAPTSIIGGHYFIKQKQK